MMALVPEWAAWANLRRRNVRLSAQTLEEQLESHRIHASLVFELYRSRKSSDQHFAHLYSRERR